MRRSLILLGVAVVAVLLVSSASAANRGVTFTSIGFIDDPGPFPASAVTSMNPQGTVFIASPSYFGNYCFMWTYEDGWSTEIGDSSSFCRMSYDGTIMASGLYPGSDPGYAWPGTWLGEPNLWDPIPANAGYEPCGSSRMSFYDMGGNGDYAAGLTWAGCSLATAFEWDKATNTSVSLGTPNGKSTRANAVSDDGDTVVGWGTMLFGSRRAGMWQDGVFSWIDGQGDIEPSICVSGTKYCTSNSADPTYGCPDDYVDDAFCDQATCVANVCVGGPYAGDSCTSNYNCAGYCDGGPSDGDTCTSDYYCPDTAACIDNPAWNDNNFKGEAYDISASGHIVGQTFGWNSVSYNEPGYDPLLEAAAYRRNPDGSFTMIPTSPTYPDTWVPGRISADGKTVVGMIGNPFFGSIAAFWNEGMGTQDLQLFLVQQGLDELFFWNLVQLYDVSADGHIIAGKGYNEDFLQEGFIVDMSKVWVCHAPPGNPENARTLGVAFEDVGNHLAHGDFLGTCEFQNSGGLSRSAETREQLNQRYQQAIQANPSLLQDADQFAPVGKPAALGVTSHVKPALGVREGTARKGR